MDYKNKIIFIVVIVLILFFVAFILIKIVKQPIGQENLANVSQFKSIAEQNNTILIDVRTSEEFSQSQIAGAINIDFYSDDFVEQISNLDKNKSYAIYCRSGNRSEAATKLFLEHGFKKVTNLQGGIMAWESENAEVCVSC